MDAVKVTLVKALLCFCSWLPLPLARAFGRGAGRIYFLCGGRSRRVTLRNLALAYPQMETVQRRRLAGASLAATGALIAEMGHVWLRPWEQLSSLLLQVDGVELINQARAEGRPVVVLVPHLGNWEVLGLHLATLGPTVSLYQPPKLAGLGPLIKRWRQHSGAQLVPTDRRGLARLSRALGAGDIVGVLPDQVPASLAAGENAPFMGVPCFTATLASKLISRHRAVAVVAFAQRVRGGFHLHYRAASPEIYDEDIAHSLAAMNADVEKSVHCCPEQYQWEYKRFRVRPRLGPGVYDDEGMT